VAKVTEPEWRDPPPKGKGGRGRWEQILMPLVRNPGRWAMIFRARTVQQAMDTRDNLHKRRVMIPCPDEEWSFTSRKHEVFAIYRGKSNARVRRAKREG
jgi:hypothetical protein